MDEKSRGERGDQCGGGSETGLVDFREGNACRLEVGDALQRRGCPWQTQQFQLHHTESL